MATCIIHIDGGSRGNPGPAAFGFVIKREGHPDLLANGMIGRTTNNVAEYTGLIEALKKAAELGESDVLVRSDSELLVKQMNGIYRVKQPHLISLYQEACSLAERFDRIRFVHVYREQNTLADRLCNDALDGTILGTGATYEREAPPVAPLPKLKDALAAKTGPAKRSAKKAAAVDAAAAIAEVIHSHSPGRSAEEAEQLAQRIVTRLAQLGVKLPAHTPAEAPNPQGT